MFVSVPSITKIPLIHKWPEGALNHTIDKTMNAVSAFCSRLLTTKDHWIIPPLISLEKSRYCTKISQHLITSTLHFPHCALLEVFRCTLRGSTHVVPANEICWCQNDTETLASCELLQLRNCAPKCPVQQQRRAFQAKRQTITEKNI